VCSFGLLRKMSLTAAMRSASVSQRPGDGTSDPSTAFSDDNGGECIASVIENRAKEVPFEPRQDVGSCTSDKGTGLRCLSMS